jgi:preprotein translocase subunit SecE
MADKIKIALAALLVVAGLAGFYYFSASAMIIRVASVLAGLAAGVVVFWTSEPGKEFYVYAQESVVETKKVVWPTRKETLQTTAIVFVFELIMSLFLWLVDASLLWAVKKLLGQGDESARSGMWCMPIRVSRRACCARSRTAFNVPACRTSSGRSWYRSRKSWK